MIISNFIQKHKFYIFQKLKCKVIIIANMLYSLVTYLIYMIMVEIIKIKYKEFKDYFINYSSKKFISYIGDNYKKL